MATSNRRSTHGLAVPPGAAAKSRETVRDVLKDAAHKRTAEICGLALLALAALVTVALMSWRDRKSVV